jgi:tellurite resistance protein TerC
VSGYLIEKSLSVDNLFVFSLIFGSFGVGPGQQHRFLAWGIIGALILRGSLIMGGLVLVSAFHWVLYLFGAILIFSGVKLLRDGGGDSGGDSRITEFVRRLGLSPFITCLLVIEISDLIFALDSIPATMAVTQNPFIVYTSNIFALLGLRSLFFVLSGMLDRFEYLKYGISLVLVFIGLKILLADFLEINTGLALAVTASILLVSVVGSMLVTREVVPDVDI